MLLIRVLRLFPHSSPWGDMAYLLMPSVHCKRLWTYLCALDEPIIPADSTSISDGEKHSIKGLMNQTIDDRSNWLYRLKLLLDVLGISTVQLTAYISLTAEKKTHTRD